MITLFVSPHSLKYKCSKYGFGIIISEGIVDYALNVMLLVECDSRRIVMVTRGVMCDVGQSAPRRGPLIGAELRGFPPRQKSLVAGQPRRFGVS